MIEPDVKTYGFGIQIPWYSDPHCIGYQKASMFSFQGKFWLVEKIVIQILSHLFKPFDNQNFNLSFGSPLYKWFVSCDTAFPVDPSLLPLKWKFSWHLKQ